MLFKPRRSLKMRSDFKCFIRLFSHMIFVCRKSYKTTLYSFISLGGEKMYRFWFYFFLFVCAVLVIGGMIYVGYQGTLDPIVGYKNRYPADIVFQPVECSAPPLETAQVIEHFSKDRNGHPITEGKVFTLEYYARLAFWQDGESLFVYDKETEACVSANIAENIGKSLVTKSALILIQQNGLPRVIHHNRVDR